MPKLLSNNNNKSEKSAQHISFRIMINILHVLPAICLQMLFPITLFNLPGIAPNTMLAKVCSDKNKPNGQYRLPSTREAVMDFIENLPVRKVQYTLKLKHKQSHVLGNVSLAYVNEIYSVHM